MDVHLRDLRYAVAVAEDLSVTRAAERLYVSQPAVSKQIRALERQLGFALFVRRPDGLSLTPQGERVVEDARRLLAEWETAFTAARRIQGRCTITVGMQTAVGRGIARDLRARLDPECWQLVLRVVSWSDPSAGLLDRTSDAALLWHPVDLPGTRSMVLREEPRCVALPDDHRLAGRTEIAFGEVRDERWIALPAAAGPVRDYWLAAEERTQPAIVALEATSADEVFEAVSGGAGLSLVAEGNGSIYTRPGIAVVPVTDLSPARLLLVWHDDEDGPALSALLAAARRQEGLPRRRG